MAYLGWEAWRTETFIPQRDLGVYIFDQMHHLLVGIFHDLNELSTMNL